MDSYRDHPGDFGPAFAGGPESGDSESADSESADSGRPVIGTDERRMHVRAYNYWASLLDGRDYPSIEDLEPGDLKDFAPHSVLLDFTAGRDNPATPYIGEAIRTECDLSDGIQAINDVPSRSLLSRLTDHYMQIIANRAPVGFEAEFVNQRGDNICYRGILMPFSSDGDTIDFIYGVINWKAGGEIAGAPAADSVERAPLQSLLATDGDGEVPAAVEIKDEDEPATLDPSADAGLGDLLSAARENAEAAKAADGRSRSALYRALSNAYDFALAGKQDPDGYAELLEESGVKPQARAPMTPVVKLVFGIDYAKARLTEFAAALAHAERRRVGLGGFLPLIEAQSGGLKALVAAERLARRPDGKSETRSEAARSRLRHAEPLTAVHSDEEFALVLTRRTSDGAHELVAMIDDPTLVERAIRRAGA